jgi:hypothetical protein
MQPKIIFLLPTNKKIADFITTIETINDDISVSRRFTNNIEYKDHENIDGLYYLDNNTISSSIKNNSILYITTLEEKMVGVTIDDFYNSDIIPMSISNFNDISTNFFDKYKDDLIIVWYDTKIHNNRKELKREINESTFLLDKIENNGYKFVYFLDDTFEEVANVLNIILTGSDDEIAEIFENYC